MKLRIAITGPESSGKTTLARALAKRFGTVFTPEFARYYLEQLDRPYGYADLERIARWQLLWQQRDADRAKGLFFCDTDLVVIKVWSDVRFGRTDPWIIQQLEQNPFDLTLLCHPDIPWEDDPLRENPLDRQALLLLYLQELNRFQIPFIEIRGDDPDLRLRQAEVGIFTWLQHRTEG